MSVKSALRIKINGQWVAVPVMIGDAEIDGVVRYDGAQTLTEEEKAIARENIGAGTGGDVEIPNDNLVNGETTGSLQGIKCRAYYGDWAVALGYETEASNFGAFAAGHGAEAKGWGSVALGSHTIAEGDNAFAVGTVTKAYGSGSFAQGQYTNAYGYFSHVEGEYTIARGKAQHVQGKYNIEDNDDRYAHVVGNGYYDNDMEEYCRSNAHTLDWEGNGWFAGSVYVGGTGQDDETARKLITQADMEAYVNEAILGGAW